MFFNSIDFAIFLPIVFVLYWFIFSKSLRQQNILVVVVSYIFYGWWDWRFLFLILFSTIVDYSVGLRISKAASSQQKKYLLGTSIVVNLGFLGFFKYYNFFVDSFVNSFSLIGVQLNPTTLNIILPVGISFYTFQTLSYTIDIYKGKLKPTNDFMAFMAFVSFFPQLVAGPIERATHLLPQFYIKRKFDYNNAANGLRQILWGLLKKIVIADGAAQFANQIFNNADQYGGSTLVLGAILFAFQIYGDFSGYSDIAIGTSRLFGFDLMQNFAFPYFSRDIAEFWRRWHISLSTWFRDYLYIPLGGSRGRLLLKLRNTSIIFIVSGFWHGANWTFVVWGALNAIYFLPLLLRKKNRVNIGSVAEGKFLPSVRDMYHICVTFALTTFAWIFFRAEDVNHALSYIAGIFSKTLFSVPLVLPKTTILIIALFVLVEWVGREGEYAISNIGGIKQRYIRWILYFSILGVIYFWGNFSKSVEFIYFQF